MPSTYAPSRWSCTTSAGQSGWRPPQNVRPHRRLDVTQRPRLATYGRAAADVISPRKWVARRRAKRERSAGRPDRAAVVPAPGGIGRTMDKTQMAGLDRTGANSTHHLNALRTEDDVLRRVEAAGAAQRLSRRFRCSRYSAPATTHSVRAWLATPVRARRTAHHPRRQPLPMMTTRRKGR